MNTTTKIVMLPVSKLYHHPDNPREEYDELEELAESIRSMGILQNLTVVPYDPVDHSAANVADPSDSYIVIIGNRRLEGALLANVSEVPAVISNMDLVTQLATMDVENHLRKDTSPIKQARNYQKMLDLGETVDTIASKTGFSAVTVRNRIKLLDLDQDKFAKAEARGATMSDYLALNKLADPERKNKVLDSIGTPNFNNALQKAVQEEQRERDHRANVLACQTFAKELPDSADLSAYKHYATYAWWNNKKCETPADKDTVQYYYRVTGNEVYLYTDNIKTTQELAQEQQRKKEEEARARKKKKREDLVYRFFNLRVNFVKGITAAKAKKLFPSIAKYCTDAIFALADGMGYYYTQQNKPDKPVLADVTEIPLQADGTFNTADFDELLEKNPELGILLLTYSMMESNQRSYFNEVWDSSTVSWMCEYKPNDGLDILYEFLRLLGYVMSEEELQWQNGDHKLFDAPKEQVA